MAVEFSTADCDRMNSGPLNEVPAHLKKRNASSFSLHITLILFMTFFLVACAFAPLAQADSCNPIKTFADGKKPLREIFISPTGNNSSGTGARTAPYQTIARALQEVRPGDAIRLLPGTYSGGSYVENLSGTAEAPIWIGGEPGSTRPIISGGSLAFHLSRVRYLVVENLEIKAMTGNGINCDDGGDYDNPEATRHLIFRNLFIHDVGSGGNQDGLKVSGVNDFYVLDCEFARISTGGSGIDHVGCHNGLIARCTFTAGGNAIQCKGGSENIEIRWNKFLNGAGRGVNIGGSTGLTLFRPPLSSTEPNTEAKNIRVIANLFRGSEWAVAFVGATDSLAAHNTIVEPNRWILRILQETVSSGGYTFRPCGNNQFLNNLCYFNRAQISTHLNIGSNTDAPSFQFANNLWHAFNQPNQSRPSLPSPEANGIYGSDPAFRNMAADDFSVPPTSPAAGKGKLLPNVPADLPERCYANPPTIGAFEASPPPTPRADFDGDRIPVSSTFRFAPVSDKSLGLWEGEKAVFVYNHGLISSTNAPKARPRSTYLHPIYGLDGEVITGDFEKDHDYHRGLFWGWPHIKIGDREFDLWSLRGIEQRFELWLSQDINTNNAILAVQNGWFVMDKKVMAEEVRFTAHPTTGNSRAIDVELSWTPLDEPITLWGAPGKSYGGFTLRFGPRSKTTITVPEGVTTEDLLVAKLSWADFSADFARPGKFSGIAIFVHPEHPDYPPTWMTRDYGVLAVGWPGVTPQTFPVGKKFTVRHRLYIHRGILEAEEIAREYETYLRGQKSR